MKTSSFQIKFNPISSALTAFNAVLLLGEQHLLQSSKGSFSLSLGLWFLQGLLVLHVLHHVRGKPSLSCPVFTVLPGMVFHASLIRKLSPASFCPQIRVQSQNVEAATLDVRGSLQDLAHAHAEFHKQEYLLCNMIDYYF